MKLSSIMIKWLIFGQGIIWSILTIAILLFELSIKTTGIVFTWIIAVLFAIIMTAIDSKKENSNNLFN